MGSLSKKFFFYFVFPISVIFPEQAYSEVRVRVSGLWGYVSNEPRDYLFHSVYGLSKNNFGAEGELELWSKVLGLIMQTGRLRVSVGDRPKDFRASRVTHEPLSVLLGLRSNAKKDTFGHELALLFGPSIDFFSPERAQYLQRFDEGLNDPVFGNRAVLRWRLPLSKSLLFELIAGVQNPVQLGKNGIPSLRTAGYKAYITSAALEYRIRDGASFGAGLANETYRFTTTSDANRSRLGFGLFVASAFLRFWY